MAKVYNNVLGDLVGKIGPYVGYLWRGRPVFRAYVQHIRYPNTERQQAERDWFVSMVRFAAVARPALLLGMHEKGGQVLMTEGNYFIQRNKRHFHHSDGKVSVDYSRLAISEGPVAPVTATKATIEVDGVLNVDYDKNSRMPRSKSSDNIYLFVYDADEKRGLLSAPVHRNAGHISYRLPDDWQQHDLHCYLFATDAYGHASATSYTSSSFAQDNQTENVIDNPIEGNVNQGYPEHNLEANGAPFASMNIVSYPRGKPVIHHGDT